MALVHDKKKTDRIATPKQLISNKENFFIFRLKGLISNVHQMRFFTIKKDEHLQKVVENIMLAKQHLQAAEIYFKQHQKARIKEGEKK